MNKEKLSKKQKEMDGIMDDMGKFVRGDYDPEAREVNIKLVLRGKDAINFRILEVGCEDANQVDKLVKSVFTKSLARLVVEAFSKAFSKIVPNRLSK